MEQAPQGCAHSPKAVVTQEAFGQHSQVEGLNSVSLKTKSELYP